MSFLLHRQGVMAQAVRPPVSEPLVFIDSFARENEPLATSGNWTLPWTNSVLSVVNTRAQSTGSLNHGYARCGVDVGQDHYVDMDARALVAASGSWAEAYLRMAANSGAGYGLRVNRNGSWNLGRRSPTATTLDTLGTGSIGSLGETFTVRLEVVGHTLTASVNGSVVTTVTVTDNLIETGQPGFLIQPPNANRPALTITRFEAGSL